MLKNNIQNIVKCELHCHLAGAYENNYELENIPMSFDDFLTLYMKNANSVKTLHGFRNKLDKVVDSFKKCNTVYLQLKIAYSDLNSIRQYGDNAIAEMLRTVKNNCGITLRYTWVIERHLEKDLTFVLNNLDLFDSFDIAGDESKYSTKLFTEQIKELKSKGLDFVPHAGELSSIESIEVCLELGAKRIGHGLAILESKQIMDYVKDNNIILEVSPTSNHVLGLYNVYNKDNPLRKMFKNNLPVHICTDDKGIFKTNLNKEYMLLIEQGYCDLDYLERMNMVFLENNVNKINS